MRTYSSSSFKVIEGRRYNTIPSLLHFVLRAKVPRYCGYGERKF